VAEKTKDHVRAGQDDHAHEAQPGQAEQKPVDQINISLHSFHFFCCRIEGVIA
jgi:hypothetical protein